MAYQIYPKSFYDSNGDGIGDIPGIISKLDYLRDLGVDIIWLSPCYQSPLADQGYDISDYYSIDPRFGTMEDMEQLIAEAKKRDMYILMDLVVNHCSDEHEWFRKACEDPEGKYGNFFYLRDKKDGELPTNWRSYFGGSVWEDLPGTNKQYLHVFHKKQPDLNWENPQLREEVYKNINWWLDKGLGGFRIDAIINIKKHSRFAVIRRTEPTVFAVFRPCLRKHTASGNSCVRCATGLSRNMTPLPLVRYSMKTRKKYRISSAMTATFPACLILMRQSLEAVRTAGTMQSRLPRTTTSAAVSSLRRKPELSVFFLISLKTMMNRGVSATIFQKATAVRKAKRCWRH